jgi:hypothetical protein
MTVSTETNTKNVTYSNASYLLEQMLQGYDIRLRPGFGGVLVVECASIYA